MNQVHRFSRENEERLEASLKASYAGQAASQWLELREHVESNDMGRIYGKGVRISLKKNVLSEIILKNYSYFELNV